MITEESDVQTAQLVGQMGEESNPPNGSLVVLLAAGEAFKLAIASDEGVVPDLAVGGKRIYAVDAEGAVIAEVRLEPTGEISLIGPEASFVMAPSGSVMAVNGAAGFTMSADGVFTFTGASAVFDCPVSSTVSVTAPSVVGSTDVTFAGKSAVTHLHGPGSGGNTGVPL
jgi:hypothetical protein